MFTIILNVRLWNYWYYFYFFISFNSYRGYLIFDLIFNSIFNVRFQCKRNEKQIDKQKKPVYAASHSKLSNATGNKLQTTTMTMSNSKADEARTSERSAKHTMCIVYCVLCIRTRATKGIAATLIVSSLHIQCHLNAGIFERNCSLFFFACSCPDNSLQPDQSRLN